VTRAEAWLPGTPAVSLDFRNNIFKNQSQAYAVSACENKGVFFGRGHGASAPPGQTSLLAALDADWCAAPTPA
jgi:hypothetical protein